MNHGANMRLQRSGMSNGEEAKWVRPRTIPRSAIHLAETGRRLFCLTATMLVLVITGCDQRQTPAAAFNPASPVAAGNSNATPSAPAAPAESRLIPLVPVTNMVAIRAGSFLRIKSPVRITHDYWLSKFEVTQGEYEALMGRNPSNFKGDSQLPVEKVSFVDAEAFCTALTKRERDAGRLPQPYAYRLPTEAEWEYACRAGTTNRFSFGDTDEGIANYAWTSENAEGTTHPVGQKQPNPWGLYDMHGNVWEWCLDWFADYPPESETDPVGPMGGKYKLFRGGSWNHDNPFARSGNRFMMNPSNGIHFVGFRVALGVPPPAPFRPAQVNQPTAPQRRN